ncbi:MAG: two-component system response regulator [Spirochaetaceae bacterium]|nr:two-component system response regulator [Spirochaetaceae bacterium]
MTIDGQKKPTILIVDDSPDSVALLSSLLRATYRVKVATSGAKALSIVASDDGPDLVLLDIVMPEMDGYEICGRLKRDPRTADVPVIFLTGKADSGDEERGFELGAEDYITKPPSPPIVLARIRTHLRLKAARDFLKDQNAYLDAEVARRTSEVGMIQDVTMIALGSLAETRDNETGNHIRRTQYYILLLAETLAGHPRFKEFLKSSTIDLLYKSAPLHDIGKVGIPDSILKKPGKLDPEEFEIMKKHTLLGCDAIIAAEKRLDSPASFLSLGREIAWSHHEKWDGTGYPRGLSGEDIPLAGRLMAIPDVYDALISQRVYKKALPHEDAVAVIMSGSGIHFDPDIAEAFLSVADRFRDIARNFSDPGKEGQ